MTPADELKAAAEKLRALAAEASSAPWNANQWGNVETAGYEEVAEVWPLQAGPDINVNYIAAMHPGVGTALADWLDAEAAIWDAVQTMTEEYGPKGVKVSFGISTQEEALTVARTILGRQP